jgi:glycosyltransferase 2 family protein
LATGKKRLRTILQLAILGLVVWGIVHSVRKSAQQLSAQRVALAKQADQLRAQAAQTSDAQWASQLQRQAAAADKAVTEFWLADPGGLCIAGAVYAVGMLPGSLFWRECLRAFDQPTHLLTILWAYFYGNLGKYFPGKAMVIILRLAALEPLGIKKTATSITIFMETLTMMSVGGAMAAVCMIALNIDWRLTLLSVGLLVATFLPTFPPLLRYLIPKLQRGVDPVALRAWAGRIDAKLFVRGWLWLSATWVAYGLSLLLVLRSLPIADFQHTTTATLWLSCMGACALAVVLGFVSLLPGGAGVREAVLSIVLAPVVGPFAALCGAIWLRVVWLATELLMVGLLLVLKQHSEKHKRSEMLHAAVDRHPSL